MPASRQVHVPLCSMCVCVGTCVMLMSKYLVDLSADDSLQAQLHLQVQLKVELIGWSQQVQKEWHLFTEGTEDNYCYLFICLYFVLASLLRGFWGGELRLPGLCRKHLYCHLLLVQTTFSFQWFWPWSFLLVSLGLNWKPYFLKSQFWPFNWLQREAAVKWTDRVSFAEMCIWLFKSRPPFFLPPTEYGNI